MFVFDGWLLGINDAQVEIMVKFGTRPPLNAITGPANLVSSITRWIPLCWREKPDERPSFDGN